MREAALRGGSLFSENTPKSQAAGILNSVSQHHHVNADGATALLQIVLAET
jgi:hypothetical protein